MTICVNVDLLYYGCCLCVHFIVAFYRFYFLFSHSIVCAFFFIVVEKMFNLAVIDAASIVPLQMESNLCVVCVVVSFFCCGCCCCYKWCVNRVVLCVQRATQSLYHYSTLLHWFVIFAIAYC